MKKLNFNNQISDDDEKLISLLKTSLGREPSEKFVENTLEKFLVLKATEKKVYKPLKSPLYMMLVIGLILIALAVFSFGSQIYIPDFDLELKNVVENISFQLNLWYALPLILLLLVSMFVVWYELGFVKFRNPFV